MGYKVGDIVRIRSKEWLDAHRDGKIFVPEMICYAGKIANIKGIPPKGGFLLDINNGSDGHSVFAWEEWMFDPDYNLFGKPLTPKGAILAMLDGEFLYDEDGNGWRWDEDNCLFGSPVCDDILSMFDGLYRRPLKQERHMTRWEILDWANSEASRGWVVYHAITKPTSESGWHSPQYTSYGDDIEKYWRARLLPDLSGVDESTIQHFTVEE